MAGTTQLPAILTPIPHYCPPARSFRAEQRFNAMRPLVREQIKEADREVKQVIVVTSPFHSSPLQGI
jgi:hypothetical protein